MGPLVEGLLGALMWMRRASALALIVFVALVLWLAARRAGRRGLEIAVLMLFAAAVMFTAAVFASRPPMTEEGAIALALTAALLVVGSVGVVLRFGLRRRRPPKVTGHRSPPWEGRGW